MPRAQVNGAEMYYEEAGSGPICIKLTRVKRGHGGVI
jgi:hypothetical protein